jgi:hypothetical protein
MLLNKSYFEATISNAEADTDDYNGNVSIQFPY